MDMFQKKFQHYKFLIDQKLQGLMRQNSVQRNLGNEVVFGEADLQVCEAMSYSLNIGGKRIRPIVTLAFCEICGCDQLDAVLDIACAIEMIHTYSLIHDDMPCMDNDELRRGKPSCHVKFGQATALLAGDALLTFAFDVIANTNLSPRIKIEVIKVISDSIGHRGMILGQNLDINNIENVNIDIGNLDKINLLKTGQLIKAAAVAGCVVAGADQEEIDVAGSYGLDLGLAFQIRDDVLDEVGDEALIGKPVGSDKSNNKVTYANLLGIDACCKKVKELCQRAKNRVIDVFEEPGFIVELTDFLLKIDGWL